MTTRLITCVDVERELPLLAHFLDYYLALGVAAEAFHVIANTQDAASPRLDEAAAILADRGMRPPKRWVATYTSDTMWQERRKLQEEVAAPEDWIVSADVDEFHQYPAPLAGVLAYCEKIGVNAVQGPFIDRLAEDGVLRDVAAEPDVLRQYPVQAALMDSIRGATDSDLYGTVKLMVMRGDVMPSRGGHHPLGGQDVCFLAGTPLGAVERLRDPDFRLSYPFRVHHIKWTGTLMEGLRRRLAASGVSDAGRVYAGQVMDFLSGGEVDLDRLEWRRTDPNTAGWKRTMRLSRLSTRVRALLR